MRFEIEFLPVMAKLNFQQSLLQFTVWYDPSIILICHFGVQIIFLILPIIDIWHFQNRFADNF